MKKTITKIFPLLVVGLLLCNSCTPEVEDYFEESASERIEKAIVKYREILSAPEYGWIMEYYPGGSSQTFGGFALSVKFFEDGKVIFQSSTSEDVTTQASSTYKLMRDMGPTLNFVTYNKIFHQYSDPDVWQGDGLGKGWNGDYEFILQSGTPDEILMYGKKHGSAIHMYPLKEPASVYLQKAKDNRMKYEIIPAIEGLEGTFAGEPATAELINSQHYLLEQGDKQTRFSFMFTDKGLKIYAPIKLNGKVVDELTWDEKEKAFVSPDKNTNLKIVANPLGLRLDELLGNYTLQYNAEGNTKREVDVSIVAGSYGSIFMKGLPFDIRLSYISKKGVLGITPQPIAPGVTLAVWQVDSPGYLAVSGSNGLNTKWNGDRDNFILTFVDNGVEWMGGGTRIFARGLILWSSAGEYKGFGDSRFIDLSLVKKNK